MATKTAKPSASTSTAKSTAKTPAKTSTAKSTAKTATAKTSTVKSTAKTKAKAEPKVKENKVRKARTATETVAPVIANIMGLINNPNTSVEDLKSFRLELRKAVKATRAVVNSRKAVKTESK